MIRKFLRWLGMRLMVIESWDELKGLVNDDIESVPTSLSVISVDEHGKRFVSRVQTMAIIGNDGVTVAVTVGQIVKDFLQRAGGKKDEEG